MDRRSAVSAEAATTRAREATCPNGSGWIADFIM